MALFTGAFLLLKYRFLEYSCGVGNILSIGFFR